MKKYFTQSMTILGTVTQKEPRAGIFTIRCRSEEEYLIHVSPVTYFQVLPHLDGRDDAYFPLPGNVYSSSEATLIQRYIFLDRLIYVQGIWQEHQEQSCFKATTIVLLQDIHGNFLFETNNWWLSQTTCLADAWLEKQLSQQRIDNIAISDNSINIIGLQNDRSLQSCAWVSRLIYGLSSNYLLTGKERYRLAAKNWIAYQREYFQTISHDRKYCFWAFGKRGRDTIMVSEVSEDYPGIPLYEQICVLAGLSRYYRISQDRAVFEDIRHTIATFNELFKDTSREGGYFSHIDYAMLSCDKNRLGQNKLRKNWYSNGEHISAYLIDLILALDSMPTQANEAIGELYHTCLENLDAIVELLVERFPDREAEVPYINERFYYNWIPDRSWAWQQNRAIIGNNLRMAWTLCRVATYYLTVVSQSEQAGKTEIAQRFSQKAERLMNLAESLAMKMIPKGLDLLRGGVFDLVEREPKNGQPIEFAGSYTKDGWQQEQGILAYLMLYGSTGKSLYLDIARELSAFWHLFCVSHNPTGIFFRVEADGRPTGILDSVNIGSPARYPLLEINYLGHIYTQIYSGVKGQGHFCLYFKPDLDLTLNSINVLPDFVRPGTLEIKAYSMNGIRKIPENSRNFQIDISQEGSGCELVVEFQTVR